MYRDDVHYNISSEYIAKNGRKMKKAAVEEYGKEDAEDMMYGVIDSEIELLDIDSKEGILSLAIRSDLGRIYVSFKPTASELSEISQLFINRLEAAKQVVENLQKLD